MACTFWLVTALAALGRHAEGREPDGPGVQLTNDIGLLAEQIDPVDRRDARQLPARTQPPSARSTQPFALRIAGKPTALTRSLNIRSDGPDSATIAGLRKRLRYAPLPPVGMRPAQTINISAVASRQHGSSVSLVRV